MGLLTHAVGIHNRTVLSLDAEATTVSNGETATAHTSPYSESCAQINFDIEIEETKKNLFDQEET